MCLPLSPKNKKCQHSTFPPHPTHTKREKKTHKKKSHGLPFPKIPKFAQPSRATPWPSLATSAVSHRSRSVAPLAARLAARAQQVAGPTPTNVRPCCGPFPHSQAGNGHLKFSPLFHKKQSCSRMWRWWSWIFLNKKTMQRGLRLKVAAKSSGSNHGCKGDKSLETCDGRHPVPVEAPFDPQKSWVAPHLMAAAVCCACSA